MSEIPGVDGLATAMANAERIFAICQAQAALGRPILGPEDLEDDCGYGRDELYRFGWVMGIWPKPGTFEHSEAKLAARVREFSRAVRNALPRWARRLVR